MMEKCATDNSVILIFSCDGILSRSLRYSLFFSVEITVLFLLLVLVIGIDLLT